MAYWIFHMVCSSESTKDCFNIQPVSIRLSACGLALGSRIELFT